MSKNPTNLLVWKPKASFWISLGFLLFGVLALGVFYFESTKSLSDWIFLILYVAWTAIALIGTVYGLRTRVEADETGFRWRDWRSKWRAAKWEEVSDFSKRSRTNENGSTHTVETSQGNFEFGFEGDGKAIAETVIQRAINAPVREWEIKGERLVDEWPRRFEFYASNFDSLTRNALIVLLASVGLTVYVLWFRSPPRGDLPVSLYILAYVAPPFLIPVVPFLFWLFFWVQVRQTRPFRDQSVEVSPSGIVFQGATRVEASWSQIEAWNWKKRGRISFLELQTAGGSLEIPTLIPGFRILCRSLERFSGVSLLKAHDEESMALHPVQSAPDGTLVFRFSGVDMQLFRWLLPSLGLTMCLAPFLTRLADPQHPMFEESLGIAIGLVLFASALLLEWWLRVAQLRLTTEFLQMHVPFKNREIAWSEIDGFGSEKRNSGWVQVADQKISLSPLGASMPQRSRLHAEIEKRAFNATGSWK